MLRAMLGLSAAATLAFAAPALASPEKVGPSSSIDALGDSITRGYDSQGTGCGTLADCPANSWATGTNSGVNSYYTRLKAVNPTVLLAQPVKTSTTGGNDAKTGAKMSELAEQAKNAVGAPNTPDQVMILMGANDVCTSSEASMTSVASFRASYRAGLEVLSKGLPDARIDVSSIPNIFNLWSVLHSSTAAQLTWGIAKICQSMLAEPTSESATAKKRRENVQKRNEEFNAVLGDVCAEFIHCQYDKGAAYAIKFESKDVGTIDYFHPNTSGQSKAAENAWTHGPNFSDVTTPTTSFGRSVEPNEAGWNDTNVQVTLSAAENGFAVAGTEYKLGTETGWTRYTGPITVSAEGTTKITARSVDVNGNIEASKSTEVKIDKVGPSFTLSCPEAPITLGEPAHATVSEAADSGSGLVGEPDGEVALDTSTPGNGQTESVTLSDVAGNQTTHACNYDVHYPNPGAPQQTAGANPSSTGLITLGWSGADPSAYGITYALQHENASQEEFTDVASGLSALSFAFEGEGEAEGTWVYRVRGTDAGAGLTTAWSPSSSPIVVDETAPNPATVTADRAPDYAGDGGWYEDSVEVSASDNGDPALADGSPGSGVDPSSIPAPQTFATDGSHEVSVAVKDNAGNAAAAVSLTVQVDASAPSIEVSCPSTVPVGSSASATVSASDGQSGLASDPSGSVPINTSKPGSRTIERSATDNVGHTASSSCTTEVVNTRVIGGKVKGKVIVSSGEAVELTSTAKANGIEVRSGGSLEIEGASAKSISSTGAGVLRLCGAKVGAVKASGGTGGVVLGDGEGCDGNSISGITLTGNAGGVSVVGNTVKASVKVTANSGGATVTGNTIKGKLIVTGNSGAVADSPNTVGGKSKLQ